MDNKKQKKLKAIEKAIEEHKDSLRKNGYVKYHIREIDKLNKLADKIEKELKETDQ